MDIEKTIEDYQSLREAVHEAARVDRGILMGNDQWLRNALCENDIQLEYVKGNDYINCHGYAYTSQTMGNESFDFNIPLSALNL